MHGLAYKNIGHELFKISGFRALKKKSKKIAASRLFTAQNTTKCFFKRATSLISIIMVYSRVLSTGRSYRGKRFSSLDIIILEILCKLYRVSYTATYKFTVLLMVTDWFCTTFPSNELLLARLGHPLPLTWFVAIAIFVPYAARCLLRMITGSKWTRMSSVRDVRPIANVQ